MPPAPGACEPPGKRKIRIANKINRARRVTGGQNYLLGFYKASNNGDCISADQKAYAIGLKFQGWKLTELTVLPGDLLSG